VAGKQLCKWCGQPLVPVIHPKLKRFTGAQACKHCDLPHQSYGCAACKIMENTK
jgi:hypothetical protein